MVDKAICYFQAAFVQCKEVYTRSPTPACVKQQAVICSQQPKDAALFQGAPRVLLVKDRKHLDSEMENQRWRF